MVQDMEVQQVADHGYRVDAQVAIPHFMAFGANNVVVLAVA
jgi:hypothetical protein